MAVCLCFHFHLELRKNTGLFEPWKWLYRGWWKEGPSPLEQGATRLRDAFCEGQKNYPVRVWIQPINWELEKKTPQRAAGDSWWSKRRLLSRFMLAFGLRALLITESPTCVSTEVPVLAPPPSGEAHRDVGSSCKYPCVWGDTAWKRSPEAHQTVQVSLASHLSTETTSPSPVCEPSVLVAMWHTE